MTTVSQTQIKLEGLLRDQLQAQQEIADFSGGCAGAKLEVYICSPLFVGQSVLARHRLVNDVVTKAGMFTEEIHALTIKAWTPDEWEKKKHTIPAER